jgi:hypothetical protein
MKVAGDPMMMRWTYGPDFADHESFYVICFLQGSAYPAFSVMASGLTKRVAQHIVEIHNGGI